MLRLRSSSTTTVTCFWLVFLVTDLALCSFCFVRSVTLRVMAGMDQKCCYAAKWWPRSSPTAAVDFFAGFAGGCSFRCVHCVVGRPAGRWTRLFVARLCNERFHGPDSFSRLEVPQLQVIFTVVDFPCCGAEENLHGHGEIPQLPYIWWSMSLLCRSWCFGPDSAGHCLEVPQMQFCALGRSCSDSSSCRRHSRKVPQTSPSTSSRSVSEVGFSPALRAFFGLRPAGPRVAGTPGV